MAYCFRLCWNSGPELASTPWTRKRMKSTTVRKASATTRFPGWEVQVSCVLYSGCVLESAVNGEPENRVQKGNGYFQVPPHTPVIFGEAGGRTLFRYSQHSSSKLPLKPGMIYIDLLICFRLLCRDSGGETESMLLNETVPQWVIDITVDVSTSPGFT